MKVAVPALLPVTTPPFEMEATDGLLLTQVPPTFGFKVVVEPTQTVFDPVMVRDGFGFTVTVTDLIPVHPPDSETVTVYVVVVTGLTVIADVVAPLLQR